MSDMCDDNRFELIEKYKKELIEATNIETAPDEMAVLDDILYRFWQMGWLDKLELPPAQPERKKGKWIRTTQGAMPEQYICPFCHRTVETYGVEELLSIRYPYCHCGADMRGDSE